jgi:tungstate transport system substrate-binding protein
MRKCLKSPALAAAIGMLALALCGCTKKPAETTRSGTAKQPTAAAKEKVITLASTTSTENTGLLDVLLPAFKKRTGITVHAIAVGTGKALKLAENGDADVLIVHAPEAEEEFMAAGFGVDRTPLFYNFFLIAGPEDDPAGVKGSADAAEAFANIAAAEVSFISRGDDSGTHKKERTTWQAAGVTPEGTWYMETGQGMGATLTIADEKQGYILVDGATFLAFEDKVELVRLFEDDPLLRNPYSAIAVNPERHPHAKYAEAKEFIDWLTSEEARKLVREFTKNGKTLFHLYE